MIRRWRHLVHLHGKKTTQERKRMTNLCFYSMLYIYLILKLSWTCLIAFCVNSFYLGSFRNCAVVRKQPQLALYTLHELINFKKPFIFLGNATNSRHLLRRCLWKRESNKYFIRKLLSNQPFQVLLENWFPVNTSH